MLGIYSLIWTICHKLMWFYRNTVLLHIIFVVTHGEIFGHLGHTGPLTVKTKWRCRRCISGDCVVFLLLLKEIRLQLSHKASQQVLLQHVSHTAETDKVSLVLWSTVSQNLRPLGAARTMWVYLALCQQSTLKSQNSGCVLYSVAVRYKKSISIIETVISIDYRYIDFLASYFSDRSRGIDRVGDNWRTVNTSANPHISDQLTELRTEYTC